MLYDYKSDELVQDVILEDVETLVDDIIEEFQSLRRYNEVDIYTTSSIAREIIAELLDSVDELWVDAESENDLLYKDGNDVLITIANDGMLFVELARGNNGRIKSNEDCSLTYLYDGFGKKDVDELAENAESILVFGFEDDGLECICDECKCTCKDSEKKLVSETVKSSYTVNGKSVSKEEFDKKYAEFEDKYMDNIRDMLLNYCDLMDRFNEWQKMFW